MPLDLTAQTAKGLRNLLDNCRRLHNRDLERAVVREMHERGLATSHEYAVFPWNPDRVDQIMVPFLEIATSVLNNQRVKYTRAGGRKIGLPKDHPEHLWVDSYSAIKTPSTNAVFGCQISKPGDEPKFTLYVGGGSRREAKPSKVYNFDQLQLALADWRRIARSASGAVA